MNYKYTLYKSYFSTHIAHRKGLLMSNLKRQARGLKQHFGDFLPTDKNVKIADLGCGSGGLIWWLQQSGYTNAIGVDGSQEQVNIAQQLGIKNVVVGDVFDFLKEGGDYNLLFARDLIEHFEKQVVFDFLGDCLTFLEPGGNIVIQVPNAESPFFGRIRYGDFTHEVAFTPSSVSQLLSALGFVNIKVLPWHPAITDFKSFIRYVGWRLIEPFIKLPILIESGGSNRIVTMNLIIVAQKP